MSDVQVALSGMHLASNELLSEMLCKTLQKAHLSVPIMNKALDMLVKVLFLQALPPEAHLKFSGYSGTTQQLMNQADSYVIALLQEKQHKCQFLLAPRSKIWRLVSTVSPTRWVHCQCFKLFSARRSQDSEEEESARRSQRGYRQNDRHSSSRRHYDTHKQGQEPGLRPWYDSRQANGQHVRFYKCQRTGHVARFCPGCSTQSNSQGNQWHTAQWKHCYEDQQRQLQQLQAQVAHQFEGPQGDVPNPHAPPFPPAPPTRAQGQGYMKGNRSVMRQPGPWTYASSN